jgi:hypothetical protein
MTQYRSDRRSSRSDRSSLAERHAPTSGGGGANSAPVQDLVSSFPTLPKQKDASSETTAAKPHSQSRRHFTSYTTQPASATIPVPDCHQIAPGLPK